jgi:hypothetical protein
MGEASPKRREGSNQNPKLSQNVQITGVIQKEATKYNQITKKFQKNFVGSVLQVKTNNYAK